MPDAAEQRLLQMLASAELPRKASYNRDEVCRILQISHRSFRRYTTEFERDPQTGDAPAWALDSYTLRKDRRVTFDELADYLRRNNTYQRCTAVDPRQMCLLDEV